MTIPEAILQHSATVEPYEGETGAGGPAFGDPVVVACYFEPRARLLFGPNARQVQTRGFMMALPDQVIPVESRVTLDGEVYRAVDTFKVPGPAGDSHIEVVLA